MQVPRIDDDPHDGSLRVPLDRRWRLDFGRDDPSAVTRPVAAAAEVP